jgi:gamma-glutamylcyclotransferase
VSRHQANDARDGGVATAAAGRTLYFAYGSNMAAPRLRARVPSAEFVCVATLAGHALRFHKPGSNDGTAKCDAARTGHADDGVIGAVYSMATGELPLLDRFEGRGHGYERETVTVSSATHGTLAAETYIATCSDATLRPLDWYKEHVLRGARALALPPGYIATIEAVAADIDPDAARRLRELAIYGEASRPTD